MADKSLAIGITVGLRANKKQTFEYFDPSIRSLRDAGFTQTVFAFTEPGAARHIRTPDQFNVKVHQRKKKLGCFQNFRHGLKWLMRKQPSDWYLMLQDDCVWREDGAARVAETINQPELQGIGMVSFYTSKSMVPRGEKLRDTKDKLPKDRLVSCNFYNNAFWGAVAMAFPHDSAVALDSHPRYDGHPHQRKLDVCVGNTLRRELHLDIMMYVPSLCDHIGAFSTYNRHKFRSNQWGRRGYLFRPK